MSFPFLSAILVFVALFLKKSGARGTLYLNAGFLPLLFFVIFGQAAFFSSMIEGMDGRGMDRVGNGSNNLADIMSMLILIFGYYGGLLMLVTSGLAGSVNKAGKIPAYFALVGGILMGMALVVPINGGEMGYTALLIAPFQVIDESPIFGILSLVFIWLHVVAVVAAILWGINFRKGTNLAISVKRLFAAAYLLSFASMVVFMAVSFLNMGNGVMLVGYVFIIVMKFAAMLVGFFLAKSLGMAELIAYPNENTPACTDNFG